MVDWNHNGDRDLFDFAMDMMVTEEMEMRKSFRTMRAMQMIMDFSVRFIIEIFLQLDAVLFTKKQLHRLNLENSGGIAVEHYTSAFR
ncbi:MAG: hypothetical protein J6B76_00030 [Peptococcaceae bacterium]|nr:hypothetical protein [Peptococcaceae bacterium]